MENKLEQLHLEAIQKSKQGSFLKEYEENELAFKSSEITQQVAIEFSEWCAKSNFTYYHNSEIWLWANSRSQKYFTTQQLFQEFINNLKNGNL